MAIDHVLTKGPIKEHGLMPTGLGGFTGRTGVLSGRRPCGTSGRCMMSVPQWRWVEAHAGPSFELPKRRRSPRTGFFAHLVGAPWVAPHMAVRDFWPDVDRCSVRVRLISLLRRP